MIEYGPEYGTQEWHEARRRLVTASRFGDVMAEAMVGPNAKAFGATAIGYIMDIITGMENPDADPKFESAEMRHGVTYEPFALRAYSEHSFNRLEPGRLVIRTGTRIGCTPDAFVGKDGLVQVKCPKLRNHLMTLMDGRMPKAHKAQVQGELWITGRQWTDYVSYHPDAHPRRRLFVTRVQRDDAYIGQQLMPRVIEFCKVLETVERKVEAYALR